jgi:hypothetical protein
MNGLQSPHKLLNKYLEQYITCAPGDTGLPFTSDEPDLRIKFEWKDFEWERLRLGSLLSFDFWFLSLTLGRFDCNSGSGQDCAIPLDQGGISELRARYY